MTRRSNPRVVLVCEAAGGGVGKHVLDVAERLPRFGFDVLVAHSTLRAEPEFTHRLADHTHHGYRVANIDVDRAPSARDVVGVMQLRRAVREFGGADVLHGHSAKGGALARLARWRCARRVFYTPHAFYAQAPTVASTSRKFYALAEQALSLATDRVIATSRDELGLARTLGIPDHKLTVVENGIHLRTDSELATARARARAALGVPAREPLIGFVGRLVPQKAPRLAVDVFSRVHRAYPRTRIVLVGDGPEAPAVEQALATAGLTSAVTWLRGASGGDVLPAVDVLLVTSHYEGFPYVMLEALDAGCAIVTTSVGGARDCVVDGRNGSIVMPSTATALASAISPLLESAQMRTVAHHVSRARAREFEIGRMIDRLVTLYREAVNDAA